MVKKLEKKEHLRAVCESLGIIVPIRSLSIKDLTLIFETFRRKLKIKEGPLKAEVYFAWVLENVLVSPENFFQFLEKDSEIFKHAIEQAGEDSEFQVRLEIMNSMYNGIIEVYPVLALENLINAINIQAIPKENIPGHFQIPQGDIILTKSLIEEINVYLRKNLIGQNEAIDSVIKNLKVIGSKLSNHFSLFFIGQTGTGKTLLAKLIGEFFGKKLIKINCNEMTHGHEYARLIGAPPGFIGHTEKSFLKDKADKSSQWIFLFDEIEKANYKLFDFLLGLIDEGKIVDNSGNSLDFSKSIFIFTSNEGVDTLHLGGLSFGNDSNTQESTKEHLKKCLEKKFKPEFLNRLDDLIIFNTLSKEEVKSISELELKKYPVRVTEDLINYVVDGGYSEIYGARNINRFIKNNVTCILSEMILDEEAIGRATYIPIFTGKKLNFRRITHDLEGKENSKTKSLGRQDGETRIS